MAWGLSPTVSVGSTRLQAVLKCRGQGRGWGWGQTKRDRLWLVVSGPHFTLGVFCRVSRRGGVGTSVLSATHVSTCLLDCPLSWPSCEMGPRFSMLGTGGRPC